MSGHTKGPWTAWIKGNTIQIDNRGGDGRNPCVVHWSGFDNSDLLASQNKANARLIAAAPDLLEAAQAFIADVDASDLDDLDYGRGLSSSGLIERFRAAITRASGGGA